MAVSMHDKQKKVLVLEDINAVESHILGDGTNNGASAIGVDITTNDNTFNLYKHPYLDNNPYRYLANNDENEDNNDGNDNIEIVESPTADSKLIINVLFGLL